MEHSNRVGPNIQRPELPPAHCSNLGSAFAIKKNIFSIEWHHEIIKKEKQGNTKRKKKQ